MVNNLTLRQLRAFRSVAAEGGFGAAAKKMHLSSAALSSLIKEAEVQLGVRLFDRSTRHVSLSAIGAEFFPLVERILQDIDEAVANVTNLKEMRRGIVRLAAPEVLSCTLVPRAIAKFRQLYPYVEVRFLDVPIEEVISRTISGEVDLGLGTSPCADPSLDSLAIAQVPMVFATRRNDCLAKRKGLRWADIQDRSFVTNLRRPYEWLPTKIDHHRAQLPHEIIVVRRLNTALAMVQAGASDITMISSHVRELVAAFDLTTVPMLERIDREYAVLTLAGRSKSPQVATFLEFLISFARQWSDA